MAKYSVVVAKEKDIDILSSIKLVTMVDKEMDKALSYKEKNKIRKNIEANIKQTYKDYMMIYVGKKLAGAYLVVDYKNGLMVDEIYLFEEFRNKGIGTAIFDDLKNKSKCLYVWVYKNNEKMINFLDKLGFIIEQKGRTMIYKYDDITSGILKIMNTIKLGYRDRFGNKFIEPNLNFRDDYYLQKPKELLETKIGLCFDQVELERELLADKDLEFKTYFMLYTLEGNEVSHAFLVYESNNKYYWLEHAWVKYRGIHEYTNSDKLLLDVINKFVKTIPNGDIKRIKLYEYDKPRAGINYNRFVKHCFDMGKVNIKVD